MKKLILCLFFLMFIGCNNTTSSKDSGNKEESVTISLIVYPGTNSKQYGLEGESWAMQSKGIAINGQYFSSSDNMYTTSLTGIKNSSGDFDYSGNVVIVDYIRFNYTPENILSETNNQSSAISLNNSTYEEYESPIILVFGDGIISFKSFDDLDSYIEEVKGDGITIKY